MGARHGRRQRRRDRVVVVIKLIARPTSLGEVSPGDVQRSVGRHDPPRRLLLLPGRAEVHVEPARAHRRRDPAHATRRHLPTGLFTRPFWERSSSVLQQIFGRPFVKRNVSECASACLFVSRSVSHYHKRLQKQLNQSRYDLRKVPAAIHSHFRFRTSSYHTHFYLCNY